MNQERPFGQRRMSEEDGIHGIKLQVLPKEIREGEHELEMLMLDGYQTFR